MCLLKHRKSVQQNSVLFNEECVLANLDRETGDACDGIGRMRVGSQ